MASKTYAVMKDGEILKELKTLAAAKKLAETEGAEVFCEGLCVYAPDPVTAEAVLDVEPTAGIPVVETVTPEKYRLTNRMNVRKGPSLDADKAGTKSTGAVVEATLEGDWLHLTDDTFILYSGGKFAEKL